MSGSFRVEGAEVVFRSHVFDVERRRVRHDNTTFVRDVAVHPGAVAIVAVNDRGEIGVIRQYRATFDEVLLEIPAGTCDVVGESSLAAAQRELLEEMGCVARSWSPLGHFMNSPGWTNQVMAIFEARELTFVERSPAGPEEASASVSWMTPSQLRAALREAIAIDSTTAIALYQVIGAWRDDH